jgi:hypothetical protein
MTDTIRQGRPSGRHFPCDVRVRLSEELRTGLVILREISGISFSEIVREALKIKLKQSLAHR